MSRYNRSDDVVRLLSARGQPVLLSDRRCGEADTFAISAPTSRLRAHGRTAKSTCSRVAPLPAGLSRYRGELAVEADDSVVELVNRMFGEGGRCRSSRACVGLL
jgi:hypothetical protein